MCGASMKRGDIAEFASQVPRLASSLTVEPCGVASEPDPYPWDTRILTPTSSPENSLYVINQYHSLAGPMEEWGERYLWRRRPWLRHLSMNRTYLPGELSPKVAGYSRV